MAKKIKHKRSFRFGLAVIILLVLFIAQAYILPPGKVFGERLLKFLPLPAAFVNANAVLLGDYYDRVEIAQKINADNSGSRSAILNQLTDNKIAELIAANKKLNPSAKDLDTAYANLQKLTGKEELGAPYGISEKEFKEQILRPDWIKTNLQIWLASNKTINAAGYKRLDSIKAALSNGAAFDVVAEQNSEDARSAQIGGDMGFVSYSDVVPELFSQIANLKDHNAHVMISRYGIHVVQVLDQDSKGPKGSPRYHIRQIFIRTADYQNWFNQQKTYYSVLKLVR